MTASYRLCAIALSLLMLATTAWAHRQPGVVSRIEWSQDDQALHITHRLHAHDAVRLLSDGIALDSVDGLARIAIHVETRFALTTERDDQPMALEMIGAENDGDDVYVYQQLSLNTPPVAVQVASRLLDELRDTANTLVFVVEDETHSVVGPPSKDWRIVGLAK